MPTFVIYLTLGCLQTNYSIYCYISQCLRYSLVSFSYKNGFYKIWHITSGVPFVPHCTSFTEGNRDCRYRVTYPQRSGVHNAGPLFFDHWQRHSALISWQCCDLSVFSVLGEDSPPCSNIIKTPHNWHKDAVAIEANHCKTTSQASQPVRFHEQTLGRGCLCSSHSALWGHVHV